jgi:hypothetical protein
LKEEKRRGNGGGGGGKRNGKNWKKEKKGKRPISGLWPSSHRLFGQCNIGLANKHIKTPKGAHIFHCPPNCVVKANFGFGMAKHGGGQI